MVEQGALTAGDVLVLDNARIHYATENRIIIAQLLDLAGVRMIFLPAYSPELNPCELVFSFVKRAMSVGRGDGEMWEEALQLFHSVTHAQMDVWYRHCIMGPLR
jgi:transposase